MQVGLASHLHEALAPVLEFACVSGMSFRILWPPQQIVQAARLRDFVETIRDLLRGPFCDVAAFLVVELRGGRFHRWTVVISYNRVTDAALS